MLAIGTFPGIVESIRPGAEKMILAKAAALKRKKAAQAKAQARKKPAADRNGVENAGEEGVVTLMEAAPTAGKAPQEPGAGSKLKNLLERLREI